VWLDDDGQEGPPAWEGTVEELRTLPAVGDTMAFPGLHPQPGGVGVVEHRHWQFEPSRLRGETHYLAAIRLSVRSE